MKRATFLVLVFATTAIVEEASTEPATEYDIAVNICLSETEITKEEVKIILEQIDKTLGDSIDDKIKSIFDKYKFYIACVLEKLELMKDSKLVMDKIVEDVAKYKDELGINMDIVKECFSTLNNNNEMTREDRAVGVKICLVKARENRNKKK